MNDYEEKDRKITAPRSTRSPEEKPWSRAPYYCHAILYLEGMNGELGSLAVGCQKSRDRKGQTLSGVARAN